MYFQNVGYVSTGVYIFEELKPNQRLSGPAIIIDKLSTILLEPDCVANITSSMDIGKVKLKR